MKKLMYYAHCYLEYPSDEREMDIICHYFNDEYEILNPKILQFRNMDNYRKIVSICDALVFHPFEKIIISAGMKSEIELAFWLGKSIYFIDEYGVIKEFLPQLIDNIFDGWKVLSIEQTRKMMKELVIIGKYSRPIWW